MFRYVILGILRSGAALHGYALAKAYEQRTGAEVRIGNVYRELGRLEREGMVRRTAAPDAGDPRRAPYEITAAGLAELQGWLAQPALGAGGADEIAVRALCLFGGAADAPLTALEQLRVSLWMRGQRLERERRSATTQPADAAPILPFLLERRLAHVAADLELVAKLSALLAAAPLPARVDERRAVAAAAAALPRPLRAAPPRRRSA